MASAAAIAGILQLAGTERQGTLSAKEARKQRNFALTLYKNRYQLTMEDMRKAGLNPILAAGAGLGGGSIPSSAAASMPPSNIGSAVSSGYQAGTAAKAQKSTQSLQGAQKTLAGAAAGVHSATALNTQTRTQQIQQMLPHQVASARMQATRDNILNNHLNTPAGKQQAIAQMMMPKIPGAGLLGGAIGAGTSAAHSANSWFQENKEKIADWLKKHM